MTPRSARLTDDVLADIQGFITSGYGHLSRAAYLFVQFHDAGRGAAVAAAAGAGDHVRPPVAHRARRREDQAAGGDEHRLQPPAVSPLSACHRRCLCTFPPEFQEGIANADRSRILGDTEESDPVEWELGGTGKPPIHAVVDRSCGVGGRARDRLPRATHAPARHCGRCRRASREHAERIQARRRSRAVRVPRRHRATIDCRNHRRRRAHWRVHSRVSEPLPDHSTDAGRAQGTGPRKPSCLRWPIPITHRCSCEISASTAPTSCIESSSRTSQGSGSS